MEDGSGRKGKGEGDGKKKWMDGKGERIWRRGKYGALAALPLPTKL